MRQLRNWLESCILWWANHNTRDSVQQMKGIQLQQHECIMSYNLKALFTSVLTGPAIKIMQDQLKQDNELQQRTSMSVNNIICLLESCLRNTYFLFQGRYYEQLEGTARESPISPIVANLYVEIFEVKALSTSPHPQVCGKDMWMKLLWSLKQYTKVGSWSTSTP